MKTDFQVVKLNFFFYFLHKQHIARAWQQENTFIQAFRSVPGCQTSMCERSESTAKCHYILRQLTSSPL